MRQLFMKQLVSKESDNFIINDRRGKEIYTVSVDESNDNNLLSITDSFKEEVVFVKQIKENDVTSFIIHSGEEELLVIEADKKTSDCEITSRDLTINGKLSDMNFDLMFGYRKVGKVRKRWVSSEDAYELTIFESDREIALVALVAVLDFYQCCSFEEMVV